VGEVRQLVQVLSLAQEEQVDQGEVCSRRVSYVRWCSWCYHDHASTDLVGCWRFFGRAFATAMPQLAAVGVDQVQELTPALDLHGGGDDRAAMPTTTKTSLSSGEWHASGGLTLQSLPKGARRAAMGQEAFELDMVNAGPTIWADELQKAGKLQEYPLLEEYVERRPEKLAQLAAEEGLESMEEAKMVLVTVFGGGNVPCRLGGYLHRMKAMVSRFMDYLFHHELRVENAHDAHQGWHLLSRAEQAQAQSEALLSAGQGREQGLRLERKRKVLMSAVAMWTQTKEHERLVACKRFVDAQPGLTTCCLAFDGIWIKPWCPDVVTTTVDTDKGVSERGSGVSGGGKSGGSITDGGRRSDSRQLSGAFGAVDAKDLALRCTEMVRATLGLHFFEVRTKEQAAVAALGART
jgi:hypothetical protein